MRVLRSAVLASCAAAALTLSVGMGVSNAAAGPAAPTVAPNPVAAGGTITVRGAECTGSELFGVDVEILDADDNSIAYGLVDASDISGGSWSTTIKIPSKTAAGTYTVASLCDDYVTGFVYPDVSLTVTNSSKTHVTLGSSTVSPGDSLSVKGSGFKAGEKIKVSLHSTPVTLATWTASSAGSVSGTVVVPANTALGSHEIVLTGTTSGLSAQAELTVVIHSTTETTGSALPSTGGGNDNNVALIGLLLIAVGGSAILLTRRTRSARHRVN